MLFRARRQQGRWERLKLWLWPRVSWRRSLKYYVKRILRLSGTPYAIALGTAIGVAVSFTPLLGFHLLIAFALTWLLRANLVAAGLGTFAGNPVTFPVMWASGYELGHMIVRGEEREAPAHIADEVLRRSLGDILPLIEVTLAGSVVLGAVAGAVVYVVVYKVVSAYQEGRRRRLSARRRAAPLPASKA
jgi:uncharacterized protein (DUF2062 family)